MRRKIGFCCWVRHAVVALALLLALGGCDGNDNAADVSGADPKAALGITEPLTGSRVHSGDITIRGVGLRDYAIINVTVFTDKWYAQAGALHHSDNNSWSYEPVFLGGEGRFNHHTIRVEITHTDGSRETAEVAGIVRE